MTEDMDLWFRNPVECIRELLGSAAFKDETVYGPSRAYTSEERTERVYNEMNTGDWWWETQVRVHLVGNIWRLLIRFGLG